MKKLLILVLLIVFGCDTSSAPSRDISSRDEKSTGRKITEPHLLKTEHVPNAVQVHPKVISGGLPEGEAAFAELKSLGVKTIVSVDGALPDLAMAKKFGLKYVHLPHGYDGIPKQRAHELAKLVRDFPAPIYIHCHHGKHRSPAAASVACVGAGLISHDQGLSVLKIAGTSPNYQGLIQAADSAVQIDQELLDGLSSEFPESAQLPPIAEAMVAIETTYDHVKQFAANDWQPIAKHPDLDAAHEALLLREHMAELLRSMVAENSIEPASGGKSVMSVEHSAMIPLMQEGVDVAGDLERALQTWKTADYRGDVPASVTAAASAIELNCTRCHREFRDRPRVSVDE